MLISPFPLAVTFPLSCNPYPLPIMKFKQFLNSQNMTPADYFQYLLVVFAFGYLAAALLQAIA